MAKACHRYASKCIFGQGCPLPPRKRAIERRFEQFSSARERECGRVSMVWAISHWTEAPKGVRACLENTPGDLAAGRGGWLPPSPRLRRTGRCSSVTDFSRICSFVGSATAQERPAGRAASPSAPPRSQSRLRSIFQTRSKTKFFHQAAGPLAPKPVSPKPSNRRLGWKPRQGRSFHVKINRTKRWVDSFDGGSKGAPFTIAWSPWARYLGLRGLRPYRGAAFPLGRSGAEGRREMI